MAVFCGIDWAEGHHDIALIDGDGSLIAKRRINESLGVPGHKVGDSRLVGGRPPSAVCRRRVL